jgi:hypothetical protein
MHLKIHSRPCAVFTCGIINLVVAAAVEAAVLDDVGLLRRGRLVLLAVAEDAAVDQRIVLKPWAELRAILNFTFGPRGDIWPLGGMFTPLFARRGEHSLLFRRMEGQADNFTPMG